ncbi:amidase [Tunturiibacter empetritectus]|uniref:Asp-tRNA(Asn)/Glu-tRNA(Gln) amidotransferase A subunit family amidase n=1 Tax=Tunturiibacter lichenicola TaxID=2051959 RepID=A0A852VBR6_9BACT|nr:amidase [Edaphobacter lichenicola]NYF88721.1 Asp-tRNA(Asn)/Glu-tRNA(Gln) amidotransferase A subunit family amidase [Edaphobacter lichenicola]
MSDLLTQPAVDLLALLATRRISALELAEEHIARIELLNPQLNALIDFDPDRIRQQARSLDNATGDRGPLHGLPLTIKASISVAGHRCETGSLLHQGHVPAHDAEAVKRLRAAGAIILGTTNCPEFLMAYETDNRLYGRTNNPWDLTRTAGGSSGGEAAAIAAGLSAGGLGSDGGGSVRTPAHFTGICALKPTPGRIPAAGHLPPCAGPFSLLGTIGPMARTIADVSLLFRVVSGALDTDPIAAPVPYRPVSLDDIKQIPIGYFEDDGIAPVTPETRQAVLTAAESLRRQGFRVEPFRPKALEAACQLWYTLFVRCGAMLLEPHKPDQHSLLSPTFLDFLDIAHTLPPPTANELLQTWAAIDPIRSLLLEEMRAFPILLSPVCSIPAFRHGERQWTLEHAGASAHAGAPAQLAYLDAMRYTQWSNLLGSPSAVVPIARSPENLPIAIQLTARAYADEAVLAAAATLDRVRLHRITPSSQR